MVVRVAVTHASVLSIPDIRKDLPQQTRPNRPPLGMKVKVRIDAAADKFQLRHLRNSLAIGTGITQFANSNKPTGVDARSSRSSL